MNIVFIGAGNVATHLAVSLKNAGENILQIFSRTTDSARLLAQKLNADYTDNIAAITPDADAYFYTVTDNALPLLIEKIRIKNGIHIHTAGSIPIDIFAQKQKNYGVLYPLQTFSKNKKIDLNDTPIFIESSNENVGKALSYIAQKLSSKIYTISSEERERIHLAAVFACNFTNHMFAIAEKLSGNIPFEVFLPLIDETIQKIREIPPSEAQTGPAKRNDTSIIEKHLKLLTPTPEWQRIYKMISEDIAANNKSVS